MLISTRLPQPPPPAVSSSMTIYDNSTDCNHLTNSTSLVPPTSIPKHFTVPFAIQHGYFRCIRYLLQLHYDPNERDSQLRTPLILCAYVEDDRWSLSLTRNLIEKGAKIALEDHARRNAMHHACALQRVELVQLYLSCLDYNIEAKDCEGNTCLHYVAITGNCEIAELLVRSAEKVGIRLDRYVNREGCSAAVLALKYGHIECANQITHRDSDEFFVVPRPLSIYENHPPATTIIDGNHTITTTTKSNKKNKIISHHLSPNKNDNRPSTTLSFGLLKIIFNDNDTGYSTRLASLCRQNKQIQHSKPKKQEAPQISSMTIKNVNRIKSTVVNSTRYSSTQALINESSSSHPTKQRHTSFDSNEILHNPGRISPRMQLLIHQQQLSNTLNSKDNNSSFIQRATSKTQLSIDDINTMKSNSSKNDNEEAKGKTNIPSLYQQISHSTLNQSETNQFPRPPTTIIHNHIFINPTSSQISPPKIKSISPKKKKSVLNDRRDSTSNIPKQNQSTSGSQLSTHPQAIYPGRQISSTMHRSTSKSTDLSCQIREAKGATSRYNKPEELFGLRPEELFGQEQHQPKILDQRLTTKIDENKRSKRNQLQKQQYIWQQDIEKIIQLYNIQHSVNYRKSVAPPLSTTQGATDTIADSTHVSRPRRASITKNSKISTNPKQSTFASLNIPRRNSITRPSIKLTNT